MPDETSDAPPISLDDERKKRELSHIINGVDIVLDSKLSLHWAKGVQGKSSEWVLYLTDTEVGPFHGVAMSREDARLVMQAAAIDLPLRATVAFDIQDEESLEDENS